MSSEKQKVPRIGPLPQAEWTPQAREVFAYWEGPNAYENGSRSNVMMTLANHPQLAIASLDMGKYILTQSTLTERQKELIVLRVAWRFQSDHQWTHHVISARKIGFTDPEFEALQQEGPCDLWNEEDQAIITMTDQLCAKGSVDDDIWATLAKSFDRHGLMDLIYSAGFFSMNAWAFGAMQLQLEDDVAYSTSAADMLAQR